MEGEVGEERRRVIEEACAMEGVDAVGSAPYVEKAEEGDEGFGEEEYDDPTGGRGARNVEWVFELAERWGLDVDCESRRSSCSLSFLFSLVSPSPS